MDATITSDYFEKVQLRKFSTDNVGDHLFDDASLVLKDFSNRSRILPLIKCLNSRLMSSSFGSSTMRNFSEGPGVSIRPF